MWFVFILHKDERGLWVFSFCVWQMLTMGICIRKAHDLYFDFQSIVKISLTRDLFGKINIPFFFWQAEKHRSSEYIKREDAALPHQIYRLHYQNWPSHFFPSSPSLCRKSVEQGPHALFFFFKLSALGGGVWIINHTPFVYGYACRTICTRK